MTERILFARIGWMKFYEGPRDDDPKPIGGGSFTKQNSGGEIRNFFVRKNGEVFGFVHSGKRDPGKSDGLNLKRIDPDVNPIDGSLDGVFVIFLARIPVEYHAKLGKGTCIVGWYRNATVYDTAEHVSKDPETKYYNLRTHRDEFVRINFGERKIFRLSGPGGIGQTNVRYPYTETGELITVKPMSGALKYIQNYNNEGRSSKPGENTFNDVDAEEALYQKLPWLRKAVEDYSVSQAERYYKKLKYQITRKGKPYDLLCERGRERLFVEVKGTMKSGSAVILTQNEVDQEFLEGTDKGELFVVCEIRSGKGDAIKLSGGKVDVYSQWKPREHPLLPFQYTCKLDKKRRTKCFPISNAEAY